MSNMSGADPPQIPATPESERAEKGAGGRPEAAEAVGALEECRRALARARRAGAGVREAERILRIAEGFVRTGSFGMGRRYALKALALLEARSGEGAGA